MNPTLLEKIALKNLFDRSLGRFVEMAYRHYSKTYHTALHVAQEVVPEPEVVRIYFEDIYASKDYNELIDLVEKTWPQKDLEEINAGKPIQSSSDLISDDAWVAMQNMKAKKAEDEQKKTQQAKATEAIESVDKLIEEFNTTMRNIAETVKYPNLKKKKDE